MVSKFFLAVAIVAMNWIAANDATTAFPTEATTSCGRAEKNPCESDEESEALDSGTETVNKKYLSQNDVSTGSSTVLDLSGRGFEGIDKNAFDNAVNVTSLDLADNDITELPEFIFSKLTNLRNLSLAGNRITTVKKAFAGLDNLELLDISMNPMTATLDDNCFFGLPKSCWISMKGVVGVERISGDAFGNEMSASLGDPNPEDGDRKNIGSKSLRRRALPSRESDFQSAEKIRPRFQVCIRENVVQRLDLLKYDENRTSECSSVRFENGIVWLNHLNISKFEKGWFKFGTNTQVPFRNLFAINLSYNKIVRVTSDVLNDIPMFITSLYMGNNEIERLERKTFNNSAMEIVNLNHNLITEIEDDTFLLMPRLNLLHIRANLLKDIKFVATLPTDLIELQIDFNKITEIPADSFSHFKNLDYVNLSNNRLKTVASHSFRGAAVLFQLELANNEITTVEKGAFDGVALSNINLGGNKISNSEMGLLTGLDRVSEFDISNNLFTKIPDDIFDLQFLTKLDLSGNNITTIEKGSMRKLGSLEELDISKNPIKKLENGALFGLKKIKKTAIMVAETPIEAIQGGLFDDV